MEKELRQLAPESAPMRTPTPDAGINQQDTNMLIAETYDLMSKSRSEIAAISS